MLQCALCLIADGIAVVEYWNDLDHKFVMI
jgi:hypothetical protein